MLVKNANLSNKSYQISQRFILFSKNYQDGSFTFSARLEIDEINNDFDITLPTSESYETLGGYIVHNTAEIPVKNQKVLINDLFFEIIEVSNTKIELVRISKK